MYKQNMQKHMKKDREKDILPNNNRTASTRNDYERKINYDWSNSIIHVIWSIRRNISFYLRIDVIYLHKVKKKR